MTNKRHYVDSIIYKLTSALRICDRHFHQMYKENFAHLGISSGELFLLDTVVKYPEITQIELARLIMKGRAHVTQMLSSLEERGIIERINQTKHGRAVRITQLTQKGYELYSLIEDGIAERCERIDKVINKKEKFFQDFIDELLDVVTEGKPVRFD